ncbi:MAG TPA: hypothetical protein VHC22_25910 [Pirellulales bacterium]|nr:hypothetical protein [Pirellulales bacterium]
MSSPPRRQFGLRTMFGLTAVCAGLFATFRWLGLSPASSLFVAALLALALVAAVGLVTAISAWAADQDRSNDSGPDEFV